MPTFRTVQCALTLLLVTLSSSLGAQSYQNLQSIRMAAEQHAREIMQTTTGDIELSAGRLDNRLKLTKCNQPLEGFTKSFQKVKSNLTIGVRCNDQKGWSLYVPVRAAIFQQVLIVNNQIARNSIIMKSDIVFEKRDVTRLRKGHFSQISQLVGKKTKRTLNQGDIITPSMVSATRQVVRGKKVTILAAAGNILVRMNGKALGNGSMGERVKVINTSSKREVEALVVGPGLVKVTL